MLLLKSRVAKHHSRHSRPRLPGDEVVNHLQVGRNEEAERVHMLVQSANLETLKVTQASLTAVAVETPSDVVE